MLIPTGIRLHGSLLRVAIILALGCAAAAGSARADQASTSVSDNFQFNCNQTSTVSSGATSQSCNIASTGVSGSLQATASLGTSIVGASASFNASQPGIDDLPVSASASIDYAFSVAGVSSGTADIDLVAQGSSSCVAVGGSPECTTAGILLATGVQNGANVVLPNGTSYYVAEVPFTSSPFEFGIAISAQAACATLYGITSCGASSNYLDTVSITGAQIYDSSGNLVSGASIVSETGFNPNAPVATPEPSCLMLLGAGLIALTGFSFKKTAI